MSGEVAGVVSLIAEASGIPTVPASSRDELAFTVMVLAVPEKVMLLAMTALPVTVNVADWIDVIEPAPFMVAVAMPPFIEIAAGPAMAKSLVNVSVSR